RERSLRREFLRSRRTVRFEPAPQLRVGATNDRRDLPERVVEIESDGADLVQDAFSEAGGGPPVVHCRPILCASSTAGTRAAGAVRAAIARTRPSAVREGCLPVQFGGADDEIPAHDGARRRSRAI